MSINPTFSQFSGKWSSAQAAATQTPSRPAQAATLRKTIDLIAGGNVNAPAQQKLAGVKGVRDSSVIDARTYVPNKSDLVYYAWNLPPHQWSRPVDPAENRHVADSSKWDGASDLVNRRGRIYYYLGIDSTQINSTNANLEKDLSDRRYGFQFLWNPQSFATAVSMNPDITPSAEDKFVKVVGAFPSTQVLSVQFRIDRTNDLYCLRSHSDTARGFPSNYSFFQQYYRGSYDFVNGLQPSLTNFNNKVKALQTQGTLADLEYLYKAINGAGWKNIATGRDSSDIGFLSPTLLKIEIGPVAYLGYVTELQVNHSRFTKGMIPIETDVSVNFNLMATAGLSSRADASGTARA